MLFRSLEDPDAITRTVIQQREYMMNALTPDEIREANSLPPLPGGWGRLSMYQMQILLAQLSGKASGQAGQAMGSRMSGGTGGSGTTGGSGGLGGIGTSSSGTNLGQGGMNFSATDVTQMLPDEIAMYQMLGLLPPTQQLGQQMEEQQPGVLETLSDELRQFFEKQETEEEESQVMPRPVTKADEMLQQEKFDIAEHQESLAEKMINRRGVFGPAVNQQYRQSAERGKYPRSGGKYPAGNTPYEPGMAKGETQPVPQNSEVQKKAKQPKRNYRPGQGNQYR